MDPTAFDSRAAALVVARVRIGFGLAGLIAPGLFGRLWMGESARTPGAKGLARAVSVRDFVLGVGTVLSVKDGSTPENWLGMCAVTDGLDALVTLLSPGVPRRSRLTVAPGALALAAIQLRLAQQLADEAAAEELSASEA